MREGMTASFAAAILGGTPAPTPVFMENGPGGALGLPIGV